MNYDPGWWKAAFQIATFVFSILVIVATAGNWYFGRREEATRERVRASQREEDQSQLRRMEASINELVAKGRLSRQDANKLLEVIISEQMPPMKEKLQVEIKKVQPEKKP